jgi:hypothetical protein
MSMRYEVRVKPAFDGDPRPFYVYDKQFAYPIGMHHCAYWSEYGQLSEDEAATIASALNGTHTISQLRQAILLVLALHEHPQSAPRDSVVRLDPMAEKQLRAALKLASGELEPPDYPTLMRRLLGYMEEADNPELWNEAWTALGE